MKTIRCHVRSLRREIKTHIAIHLSWLVGVVLSGLALTMLFTPVSSSCTPLQRALYLTSLSLLLHPSLLPLLILAASPPLPVSAPVPLYASSPACPRPCFCNPASRIVYCSRRGLQTIPDGVAPDTLQLNLNGNVFQTSTVGRTNFSRYGELEHLYMSECGVEELEVDTFLDLGNLKWLDLSSNRLKVIQEHTFRGLTLEHLFLNGNRLLQLLPGSLEGLDVSGLYLHDCSMQSLRPEVIETLNGTLNYLWLNGNELERLDRSLGTMFSSFQHLRLGSNPLCCGCDAVWLKEFYDSNSDIFKGALQPACSSPPRLKGAHFDKLELADFRCQAPIFNNIDVMFADGHGRLKCSATGDPLPTLFWIQPTGKTTKYGPPTDGSIRATEGLLALQGVDQSNLMGMYICVANNEAGNVTLAVNLTWPQHVTHHASHAHNHISHAHSVINHASKRVNHVPPQGVSQHHLEADIRPTSFQFLPNPYPSESSNANFLPSERDHVIEEMRVDFLVPRRSFDAGGAQRLFSVAELVGAVAVTHALTLLLAILLLAAYYRRRGREGPLDPRPARRGLCAARRGLGGAGCGASEKYGGALEGGVVYENATGRGYAHQTGLVVHGVYAHSQQT